LALPHDGFSQRYEISNIRAGPEILKIPSRRAVLAPGREGLELLISRVGLGIQFFGILLIKLSGNSFVNAGDHRILPEYRALLHGIETINWARAGGRSGRQIVLRIRRVDPRYIPDSTRITGNKVIESLETFAKFRAAVRNDFDP
jgi:hypothetical protein